MMLIAGQTELYKDHFRIFFPSKHSSAQNAEVSIRVRHVAYCSMRDSSGIRSNIQKTISCLNFIQDVAGANQARLARRVTDGTQNVSKQQPSRRSGRQTGLPYCQTA